MTLEDLIKEGQELRAEISYVDPGRVLKTYSVYKIDTKKYEKWKNITIRFLLLFFPNDRCISDFEKAATDFEEAYNAPKIFDKLIGILESCLTIPTLPLTENKHLPTIDKSISINLNQSQNQSQEQLQNIAIKIFIEAIQDELTGKQFKEIKEIFVEESNPKKAHTKIFNKIKSFGTDVASNIIANILTNPAIWGNL